MSLDATRARNLLLPENAQRWFITVQLFVGLLVCSLGGFLLWRRIAGELQRSTTVGTSTLIGVVLAIAILGFWATTVRINNQVSIFGFVLVFAGCLIFALAIPVINVSGVVALWTPVFLSVFAGMTIVKKPEWLDVRRFPPRFARIKRRLEIAKMADVLTDTEACPLDPSIDQLIIRSRDDEGLPIVFGRIRGRFGIGERTKNLHIAFCPPFDGIPDVLVELYEGPDADFQVGQAIHSGTRIDVKLHKIPTEEISLVLEVYAKLDR